MRRRIAVLASGSGSNLQSLLDHFDALGKARSGDVVLVASDRESARALNRARARDIAAVHLENADDGSAIASLLDAHGVDLVVLAGYLKYVPPGVTATWRDRVLNVHPALLPAFGGAGMYGQHVHAAVLASGARITGVTVHLVNEVYDDGRILAQWPVPVMPHDSTATLAARVLRAEHLLYPRVIDAVAAGRILTTLTPLAVPDVAPDAAPDADAATASGTFAFLPLPDPPHAGIDALLTGSPFS